MTGNSLCYVATHFNGADIINTVNFAIVNPFRYRGYYYDTESGLYYLQSRYYDPTTGRFVNADSFEYLGIRADYSGDLWIKAIAIVSGAAVLLGAYIMRTSIMMYSYAAIGVRWNSSTSFSDWKICKIYLISMKGE